MNLFEFDKPYDRDKFLDFMIDFLPDDFTPRVEPLALTDFTPKCARQATRLGVSEILQLEVLEIVHSSSRDARVAIAQDAFKLLLHKSYKNRALVIFQQENSAQYRLSLLQIEAVQSDLSSRIRRSYSNPRRYSFLLGEGAHVKTPYQFLVRNGKLKPVDGDYFKDLQNRFSVETLTQLFYKELSDWYFWTIKTVSFPNNINNPADNRKYNPENVIRLITRLIFVWFLKQKNLVEPFLFDEKELAAILRDFDPLSNTQTNYYRAILQNLFFATLNREINQREFAKDEGYLKNRSNYNVKNQYRYENDFIDKDTDHIMELFVHIPFLNGGLFECLDDRKIGNDIFCWDGFSRREDRQAFVPNRLFFAKSETVDLSSEYNNAKMKAVNVSGILEILNRYNFTIEENTPAEIEVALDPELLGRVFENLLGSFNPETQDTARKQTGSFYTPRDIVTYMVNESLVAYYTTQVKDVSEACLRNILGYEDIDFDLSETQRKALIKATYSCRIIDPACGSGAFPMGMLQQLVHVLRKLDPQNNYWHGIVLDETTKALQQAGNDDDKAELLDEIARVFNSAIHYPDYARKLYLISNCIYGVDLQSIAVQISKLRFFISLICEQDSTGDAGNNYGILPLPNLDTKFVAANTLIAIDKNEEDMKYLEDSRIKKLLDELDRVRKRQFSASNAGQKKNYREKDERLREAILLEIERLSIEHAKTNLLAENQQELEKKQTELDQLLLTPDIIETVTQTDLFGNKYTTEVNRTAIRIKELQAGIARIEEVVKKASDYSLQNPAVRLAKQLTSWNPYDQNTHADWFDPEWMFGIRDGFDIVIGNPPYIQLQKACNGSLKYADLYKNQSFTTFERTGDIYCLFYEKGMSLLREGGHLAFITSNKWMRAGYGEKLRRFFTQYNPKILIDLGPGVFNNATVDTNILLIQKAKNQRLLRAVTVNEKNKNQLDFTALLRQNGTLLTNFSADAWFIGSNAEQQLKEKIERIGKPLKEWDVNIYRGILTGLNEAFIIDSDKRQEILDHCLDDDERRRTETVIKPILRGRDIKRYAYHWAGLWVIVIPAGWTNKNRSDQNPQTFIREYFPSLMNHLLSYEEKAKKRDDQGEYWWELRACAYYPEFEKEKVVYGQFQNDAEYALAEKGIYLSSNEYMIGGNYNKKYFLALLNSKITKWYLNTITGVLGETLKIGQKSNFVKIPIPSITASNEQIVEQIESLVDKILSAKKDNPAADTAALEQQIDYLVYRLYDLTEEEIRIVEKNG